MTFVRGFAFGAGAIFGFYVGAIALRLVVGPGWLAGFQ